MIRRVFNHQEKVKFRKEPNNLSHFLSHPNLYFNFFIPVILGRKLYSKLKLVDRNIVKKELFIKIIDRKFHP